MMLDCYQFIIFNNFGKWYYFFRREFDITRILLENFHITTFFVVFFCSYFIYLFDFLIYQILLKRNKECNFVNHVILSTLLHDEMIMISRQTKTSLKWNLFVYRNDACKWESLCLNPHWTMGYHVKITESIISKSLYC